MDAHNLLRTPSWRPRKRELLTVDFCGWQFRRRRAVSRVVTVRPHSCRRRTTGNLSGGQLAQSSAGNWQWTRRERGWLLLRHLYLLGVRSKSCRSGRCRYVLLSSRHLCFDGRHVNGDAVRDRARSPRLGASSGLQGARSVLCAERCTS